MSSIPVYIRFGEIPKDFQSKVYRSDQVIRAEGGVSVWDCVCANGIYYPILPENPNEHAIADYFSMLFSDKPIYLVTGTELFLKGADGEPLLMDDIKILKELNYNKFKGNLDETDN